MEPNTALAILPIDVPEDPVLIANQRLDIVEATSPSLRARAWRLVREQFLRHFGACLDPRPDTSGRLLAFIDPDGEVCGACVLKEDPAQFYLRHYIGDVNLALADPDRRRRIVELGHLSVSDPRVVCHALPLLANCLHREGHEILICTATAALRRLFMRKGLGGEVLGVARLEDLPESERDRWGSYYQHDPQVIAGPLDRALSRLRTASR